MEEAEKREEYGIKRAVWLRNYQRARSRALARLGQENPDRYRKLLEEERAKDEAEGKAWLDIRGRTSGGTNTAGHTAPESTNTKSKQAIRDKDKARDLGGEA